MGSKAAGVFPGQACQDNNPITSPPPAPRIAEQQQSTQNQKNSNELRLDVVVDDAVESLISSIVKDQVYHGSVKLHDLSEILLIDGDFAVRAPDPETKVSTENQLSVVVRWNGELREFPFKFLSMGEKERLVTLNGTIVKPSIKEVMLFHVTHQIPIEKDVLLIKRIPRPIWEVPKSSVSLEVKIGEGAFGSVWKGKLKPEKPDKPAREVAVKVTKVCEDNKVKMEEMLLEARLMRQLQHSNVVGFLGMIADGGEVMIVMELVTGGSIDSYVKNNKVSVEDKSSYCADIAFGLFYLHSRRFIHRDVAARNCLIDVANSIVKISDFGMSKQGENYRIQANERTPIRWQAPEVLRTALYTKECDVYSFGMTMYEIFSCQVPFFGIPNKTIRSKIHEPSFRPEPPEETPPEIKALMFSAWEARPEIRTTMRLACQILVRFRKNRRKPNRSSDSGRVLKEDSKREPKSSKRCMKSKNKSSDKIEPKPVAKEAAATAKPKKARTMKTSETSGKVKSTRKIGRKKKSQ